MPRRLAIRIIPDVHYRFSQREDPRRFSISFTSLFRLLVRLCGSMQFDEAFLLTGENAPSWEALCQSYLSMSRGSCISSLAYSRGFFVDHAEHGFVRCFTGAQRKLRRTGEPRQCGVCSESRVQQPDSASAPRAIVHSTRRRAAALVTPGVPRSRWDSRKGRAPMSLAFR